MLEYFVHLDRDDSPADLVLAVAEVPDAVSRERVEIKNLPATWRQSAAPPSLSSVGDEFSQKAQHCLLLVPSVLAPSENHCLINPQHPEFKKIVVRKLEPLSYDPRMFGKHRVRSR